MKPSADRGGARKEQHRVDASASAYPRWSSKRRTTKKTKKKGGPRADSHGMKGLKFSRFMNPMPANMTNSTMRILSATMNLAARALSLTPTARMIVMSQLGATEQGRKKRH